MMTKPGITELDRCVAVSYTHLDVTTNAVMPEYKKGTVELICKQDGILAGIEVFKRVFTLLDENTEFDIPVKDGAEIKLSLIHI